MEAASATQKPAGGGGLSTKAKVFLGKTEPKPAAKTSATKAA